MKTAKEIQSMPISESTAKCLEAVSLLDDVWGCITDSLGVMYGESSVDEIMDKDFVPQAKALRKTLDRILLDSISQNFGCIVPTEI